jgi:hypothetical protein
VAGTWRRLNKIAVLTHLVGAGMTRAEVLNNLGNCFHAEGRLSEAAERYRAA